MKALTIITNGQSRELITFADLPASADSDFDYITEDQFHDARFVQYRGRYYDTGDMMPANGLQVANWDCYEHWNAFAGVLIKFNAPDYDSVIVGRYYF